MYTLSYRLIDGTPVETQRVPESWNSVYSFAQFLEEMCGATEIRIYFRGELVDRYKNRRSLRNFDGSKL